MAMIPQKTYTDNNNENDNISLMLQKVLNNQALILQKLSNVGTELEKLKGMKNN